MIVASEWLLDLSLGGPRHAAVARAILRASAKVSHRWEHVLDFSDDALRRAIANLARFGQVAKVPVPCLRCGRSAFLQDWFALGEASIEEAKGWQHRLYQAGRGADAAVIDFCDGTHYAEIMRDAMDIFMGAPDA